MKQLLKIHDRAGERIVSADNLPLLIGGGAASGIQVEGLSAGEEAAYISLSEARAYAQAAKPGVPVWHNDKRLVGSARLFPGDTLRIGRCEIVIRLEDETTVLLVSEPAETFETIPPSGLADGPTAEKIEPVSFRSDLPPRGTGPTRRTWLVGSAVALLFIILSATAWFVFTSRQVVIRIDPEPDKISIKGALVAPRLGEHFLLRPGAYILRGFKEGHYPLEQPFEVGGDRSQTLRLTLEKLPGRLTLRVHRAEERSVSIDEARVYIDGKAMGIAPLRDVEVTPGRRRLEVQAEKYQNLQTQVVIEGKGVSQSLDLALAPAWAEVTISSVPTGATVRIDGDSKGITPMTLELLAGVYDLELGAKGHKSWKTRLEVEANTDQLLDAIPLQPEDGTLVLRTIPPGASVAVGNRYVGLTPQDIPLRPDTNHTVHISKLGYEEISRRVRVSSGKPKPLTLELVPKIGVVHLVVEPLDAELLINGKSLGPVKRRLDLIAVPHQVEVRKEGYEAFRTKIIPRPGFPQELKVTLTKSVPKHLAAPGVIKAANGYVLKLIHPASFMMGSSRGEQGRRSNETLRRVKLERPFYMGVKEVTNKEFREFLATHSSGVFKGQSLARDSLPVVQATWEQAAMFCNWLSAKESLPPVYVRKGDKLVAAEPLGIGYRLPTEAEWEYCARYRSENGSLKYPWGGGFPPTHRSVNIADVSAKDLVANYLKIYNDGYPLTAPPGSFKANELGLFDLGGNVAEWCHDYYSIYPYSPKRVYLDPTGPKNGKHKVVRGSSWKHASISEMRLSYRHYSDEKRSDLGFRICRYLEASVERK